MLRTRIFIGLIVAIALFSTVSAGKKESTEAVSDPIVNMPGAITKLTSEGKTGKVFNALKRIIMHFAPPHPLDTVTEFDANAMSGRWYQYSSSIGTWGFRRRLGHCITTEYKLKEDDPAKFEITTRAKGIRGNPFVTTVELRQHNDDVGKFDLDLPFQMFGKVSRPYWVFKLGAVQDNGEYPYAIITTARTLGLFVLVRDIQDYEANYKSEVDGIMKEYHLSTPFLSSQHKTKHGDKCDYTWGSPEEEELEQEDEDAMLLNQIAQEAVNEQEGKGLH